MEAHTSLDLQPRVLRLWRRSLLLLCLCALMWPVGAAHAVIDHAPVQQSPPQLTPDSATTLEDTPITIDVLENDVDPNNSGLILVAVGAPDSGTAQIVDNKIVYTPAPNFHGVATFFYSAHNGDVGNTRQTTVDVEIEAVNDAPTNILLSVTSISEATAVDALVADLTAVDPDGENPNFFVFSLTGEDNDNAYFAIVGAQLFLAAAVDFEEKSSLTIRVNVRDRAGVDFAKDIVVTVTDANDPPTAIRLSNSRIDENQAAGATVGTLSSDDPNTGDSHTYALVEGSGSDDNDSFRIEGTTLKTDTLLDFEDKPTYSIRVSSTDNQGASIEQILRVNLNNLPSPPDAPPPNTLSFCSGDSITLLNNRLSGSRQVLISISNVSITNKTSNSCTVNGRISIRSNGSTVSNLSFRGDVNSRNQFRTSSIPDFTINVAGVTLLARNVVIAYNRERAHLHITRPFLQMPREFGGLSALLSVPTLIDSGGVRFGSGRINLPTITTSSGFEMSLSGRLVPVGGGFEITADGEIAIPNIGKKKSPGSRGQTCSIRAGVTILANAQRETVMLIDTGDDDFEKIAGPFLDNVAPAVVMAPEDIDALRLSKVRAGASCSPGLPIGSTGLFLTGIRGEITLIPGRERVDVVVSIEAGKSLPVIGPVVAMEGSMGFQPRPFELDLGVALSVLSVDVARANAAITTRSFRTSVRFQALFYNGSVSITAFTRNGRSTFTGSGRLAIEIKKGSIVESKCTRFIFRICSPAIPPFSVGPLASFGADVGEFTNGRFGFKGSVRVLFFGTHGFFVDDRGRLTFRNVNRFNLVSGPRVAEARAAWAMARANGETVDAAANNEFIFLENVDGSGQDGVIIRSPLHKPAVDPAQIQAADAITQVNLIRHGDVIFNLTASAPLTFTLITPQAKEVTPTNFADSQTLNYTIEYTQSVSYQRLDDQAADIDADPTDETSAQLLFTPLASAGWLNNVDLRIDGVTVYFDMDFLDATRWLKPFPLAPGSHTVELVTHGTNNVVRSATINVNSNTHYSLISVGGPAADFVTVTDNKDAPATLGKAKVRFFNGAAAGLTLFADGAPIFNNVGYKTASDYVLIDPGVKNIELRDGLYSSVVMASRPFTVTDGGVYTFLGTDYTANGDSVALIQRQDARHIATYLTYYSVDQAQMGEEWQMKLVGDTDNIDYELAVWGPDSAPILGSVAVDASNLAATQVNWQLTSDTSPTRVSIYANPGEISTSVVVTEANGVVITETVPVFEGLLVAEFEITEPAELGGQLVNKVVDLSKLPSGTYHIWVRADDGFNTPVSVYAATPSQLAARGTQSVYGINAIWIGRNDFTPLAQYADATPIVIDHVDNFPINWTATISHTFDAATRSLYVEWRINSHPDADNYRLLFGRTPLSPTEVITVGNSIAEIGPDGEATGVEVGFVTLENILPDVPYYLSIEAVDTSRDRSVRSQEEMFTVASTPFVLTSAQPTVNVIAGNTVTVPVTLNTEQALFFPNVWLSTDLGDAAAGITAGFAGDLDGFNELNANLLTRQFEINVDAGVPSGTYPLVITGYNGEAKEILTLQLVVEGLPSTIYLPAVQR